MRWYTKAAEQGFAKAQYNLGMAYHSGEGVKKDDVEAYFWINIAASFLEQPFVKQSREDIGKLLAADQLSEVQEPVGSGWRSTQMWKNKVSFGETSLL